MLVRVGSYFTFGNAHKCTRYHRSAARLHLTRRGSTSRVILSKGMRQRAHIGPSWDLDPDKPWYHVMPRSGWLNDPNGPIFYKGKYHVFAMHIELSHKYRGEALCRFYQHVVGTSEWDWACCWAHASTEDLVHWKHEPIALEPSAKGWDAAGVWSGCSTVDEHGQPVILFTAVRRRANPGSPLPPEGFDLGLDMIESQCAATCDPGDDDLLTWTKQDAPIIEHPPQGLALTGFRDPYIIEQGGKGRPWKIAIGSGIKGQGGTILQYTSDELLQGWKLDGSLVEGKTKPCGEWDTGEMWECPFFVELPSSAGSGAMQHVLCVSPYPHYRKDRPTNPCLYWVNQYSGDRFNVGTASGPHRLDLGDILYAPNTLRTPDGRTLMLAWLQELRKGGGFDYAGCLSIPRELSLQGGRLHQQPAKELERLRAQPEAHMPSLPIPASQGTPIPEVSGPSLDVSFTLQHGQSSRAGLLLRSWLRADSADAEPTAAALVVDWESKSLQVCFSTELDSNSYAFGWNSISKTIGGDIDIADGSVDLRILIDHSAVEIFTGCGQVLTTRVYRGNVHGHSLFLIADHGPAEAVDVHAYTMGSIWTDKADMPAKKGSQRVLSSLT